MTIARDRVCLGAGLEPVLKDALVGRDLVPVPAPTFAEIADAVNDPKARAIVLRVVEPRKRPRQHRDLQRLLEQVAPVAIQRGMMVAIVVEGDRDERAFAAEAADASATELGLVEGGVFRPVVTSFGPDMSELAQQLVRHEPGRPWRDISVVDDDHASQEDKDALAAALKDCPEDKRLLQRAFSDCHRIGVRLLRTNREGRVYEVWPGRESEPDVVPFIVKTGPAAQADEELGKTLLACGDQMPFPYFPPLARDREVSGETRKALVSHFVDRAMLLEVYIENHSPAVAITSLFDGPLRCWRAAPRREPFKIGKFVKQNGLVRQAPASFRVAYRAAVLVDPAVPQPAELLKRLRQAPRREVAYCFSHGDLHTQNVFVRENSVDVVLIDFNRAGDAPASRDPAELEASLAFGPAKISGRAITHDVVRNLLRRPLLSQPALPRRSHRRALAIEQVRRQINGMVGEDEYAEMLAAHCLWYAARGNGEAYLAAARLLA
jgi:hypothetical protein